MTPARCWGEPTPPPPSVSRVKSARPSGCEPKRSGMQLRVKEMHTLQSGQESIRRHDPLPARMFLGRTDVIVRSLALG